MTADRAINIANADDSLVAAADRVKVNTNNTLTSTSTTQPLSANQGKVLNEKVVQVETDLNLVKGSTQYAEWPVVQGSALYHRFNSSAKAGDSIYVKIIAAPLPLTVI